MVIPAVCVGIVFLGVGVVAARSVAPGGGTDPSISEPALPRTDGIGPGTCLAGDLPAGGDVPLDDLLPVPCSDPLARLWIVSASGSCHDWTVVVGSAKYCARET